jgi:hypothetical protein
VCEAPPHSRCGESGALCGNARRDARSARRMAAGLACPRADQQLLTTARGRERRRSW